MAQNSSYNSLSRKMFRRARKIKFTVGGKKMSIPIIYVPGRVSTEMLVSSILNLANFSPYQRKILKELKLVRKRIQELIEEGYTFDGEILDVLENDEVTFSKKTLNKLLKMKKKYLREHAASYKGETDINKIIEMHNKEVAAKRAASRAKKAAEKEAQKTAEEPKPEDVPDEFEVLKEGIVEDEKRYIARVMQFIGSTDEDRINYAIERAQSVLNMIYGADQSEVRAILDFIDKNGKLYDVISAAESEFEGLFYDAPAYNMDLLGITPFGSENLFEHIFGDDDDYLPSSFYDFRNEVEDEDDFDDIPF